MGYRITSLLAAVLVTVYFVVGCKRPQTVVTSADLNPQIVKSMLAFAASDHTNRVAQATELSEKICQERALLLGNNKKISIMTIIALCGAPDAVYEYGKSDGEVIYSLTTNRPMTWVFSARYCDFTLLYTSVGGIHVDE